LPVGSDFPTPSHLDLGRTSGTQFSTRPGSFTPDERDAGAPESARTSVGKWDPSQDTDGLPEMIGEVEKMMETPDRSTDDQEELGAALGLIGGVAGQAAQTGLNIAGELMRPVSEDSEAKFGSSARPMTSNSLAEFHRKFGHERGR
jgi:hypothetical protein